MLEFLNIDLDWLFYVGKCRYLLWYLLSIFLLVEIGEKVFVYGVLGYIIDCLYIEDVLRELGLLIVENWYDC